MNGYARLSDVYAALGGTVARVPGTDLDLRLVRTIEQVSRAFDDAVGSNHPYAWRGMQYLRYPRELYPRELITPSFVRLEEVAYRPGPANSYVTLTEGADYWCEPHAKPAGRPYKKLVLNPTGALSAWPSGDERGIRLTGLFGFSFELGDTGQVVGSEPLAAGGTKLTLGPEHRIDIGEVLVLEPGTEREEQVWVRAVPAASATRLTIDRGVNGTEASEHAPGTVIHRRVYPTDIAEGVLERALSLWRAEFRGGAPANDFMDNSFFGRTLYPRWKELLRDYSRREQVV